MITVMTRPFFEHMSRHLISGKPTASIELLSMPLAIYYDGAVSVFSSETALTNAMTRFSKPLKALGWVRDEITVSLADVPRGWRGTLNTTIQHFGSEGRYLGTTELKLFCSDSPRGLVVQMMEILSLSFTHLQRIDKRMLAKSRSF